MLAQAGRPDRSSSRARPRATAPGQVPAADFVSQFDRALGNVLAVLGAAGGEPADIGRFTIYVTDMAAVPREPQAAGRGVPAADGDALSGDGAGGGELAGGPERGGGDRGDGGASVT